MQYTDPVMERPGSFDSPSESSSWDFELSEDDDDDDDDERESTHLRSRLREAVCCPFRAALRLVCPLPPLLTRAQRRVVAMSRIRN